MIMSRGKRVRWTGILRLLRRFRSALTYLTLAGWGSIGITYKLWEFVWSKEPREGLVTFVFELDRGRGVNLR